MKASTYVRRHTAACLADQVRSDLICDTLAAAGVELPKETP